jgi:hypothetical protein
MNDDDIHVIRDAYLLMTLETDVPLWFGIEDDHLPAAHRMAEQGWLDCVWCRECADHHYRISDDGATAIEVYNDVLASQN